MTETDWRADMTMESVAKHSHTMIQGLMRGFVVMDNVEHGPGASASIKIVLPSLHDWNHIGGHGLHLLVLQAVGVVKYRFEQNAGLHS